VGEDEKRGARPIMPRFSKYVRLLGGLCLMIVSRPTIAQPGRNDDRAQEVARKWNTPPRDSAALAALAINSARMRDARVHTAIVAVAQDAAAPRQVRLAAIQALVGHFDRCATVEFPEGPSPGGGTRYLVRMGVYDHAPHTVQGDMALSGAVREEVIRTLHYIGETDPDPAVRSVSGSVARWLTSLMDIVPLCGGAP
jgi:hypothetical protein